MSLYNIKVVSNMLDMPAVTIRAWENRYQAVIPRRSPSGHRLYSEQDIQDLRWLKTQVEEKGMNISQAVKLLRSRKRDSEHHLSQQVETTVNNPDLLYLDKIDELYKAIHAFDSTRVNNLFDLYFSLYHYSDVFNYIVRKLMDFLEEKREKGEVTIAHEHFASNLAMQRLYQFFRAFPVNPTLPKVLAFTPEGELHQLGLLYFSLFLRSHQYDVIYLGINTPMDGLDDLIQMHDIRIILISVTCESLRPLTEKMVKHFRKMHPHLQILIGGQAFREEEVPATCHYVDEDAANWYLWLEQQR